LSNAIGRKPAFSDDFLRRCLGRKRLFTVTVCLTLAGLSAVFPLLPRSYRASALLMVRPADPSGPQAANTPLDDAAIQTQVQIIKSRGFAEAVVGSLHLQDDSRFHQGRVVWWSAGEGVAAAVQHDLEVDHDRRAYTIEIGFTDRDPAMASQVANTAAALYLDRLMRLRRETLRNLIDGQGQRFDLVRQQAAQSRQALRDFLLAHPEADPVWAAGEDHALQSLNEQLADAIAENAEAQARAKTLAEMARLGTADAAPEVLASPIVLALKEHGLRIPAGSRPGLTQSELADVRRDLVAESDRIIRGAQTAATIAAGKETRIRGELEALKTRLAERRRQEPKLAALRDDSESDEAVLRDIAIKVKSQGHAAGLMIADAQLVSPAATPLHPAFPQAPLYGLGAVLTSLLAGAAAVSLQTLLSGTIQPGRLAVADAD